MTNKQITYQYRLILLLVCSAFVTGCQLTYNESNYSQYGSYYLWIKSLAQPELLEEIKTQQQLEQQGITGAEFNLLLLHSLPQSPIHNPYTAKSTLNRASLIEQAKNRFNVEDYAFIVMLKDQLNQQLLLLNKLIDRENLVKESSMQLIQQQQNLEKLEQKSLKLQQQIEQLKAIEQSINERGGA
ncbi:hypothetical protein [Thalassotalea ganghwensis]